MAATVQSILQEFFEQFAANHPLSPEQRVAAERLRDCRTPALGGHVVGCPEGHVRKVCCNSCRHRNCPQCSAGLFVTRSVSEEIRACFSLTLRVTMRGALGKMNVTSCYQTTYRER
jgi:hypothetical protein